MAIHSTSSHDTTPGRFRLPLAVYLLGIGAVLTAFFLEIARGHCPVP